MKSNQLPTRGHRFLAVLAVLSAALVAGVTSVRADEHDHDHEGEGTFHLAYGKLSTGNTFRVYDLHGDHYHTFFENTGGGGHQQPYLSLVAGGAEASISIAAANFSPHAEELGDNLFPQGTFNFELRLVSVSNLSLTVELSHDDHAHGIAVGFSEGLEFGETQFIHFAVSSEAAPGDYFAVFKIIDNDNIYADSPNFTINVTATAVPEPASAAALAGALALGLVATRRRRA